MRERQIMIIDDEVDIVRLVQKRIQANGYKVMVYDQGEGAVETIKKIHPNLLLLDLHLPQISGVDIYKAMRQQDGLKDIPVVFFSADSTFEDYCVKELGAQGFLTKPFDTNELLGLIRETIH